MEDSNAFDQIRPATVDSVLKEYPNVVPAKLERLDDQRYNIIPTAVKKRKEDVSLSKAEVATLVEWKLYALLSSSVKLHAAQHECSKGTMNAVRRITYADQLLDPTVNGVQRCRH